MRVQVESGRVSKESLMFKLAGAEMGASTSGWEVCLEMADHDPRVVSISLVRESLHMLIGRKFSKSIDNATLKILEVM